MWQEPKTNWVNTDYFNFSDYNRIKNNIQYLIEMANELYYGLAFVDMGDDKVSYAEYPYADEFNNLEENFQTLIIDTFPFDNFPKSVWVENMPTPTHQDFNRLESASLKFKEGFENTKSNKSRLSFRLGDYKLKI